MSEEIYSVIAATGSYIPEKIVRNEDFLTNTFYDKDGKMIETEGREIIQKFEKITNIAERRYIGENYVTSDIASIAAERAISSSGIDAESLDYIIVAHNFGDVKANGNGKGADIVPSLAARVKNKLGIKNPGTVAYDIIFGCPGWLQGVIQANYYIKSGDAKKVMVIGAETLSRVSDKSDRDCMLYSDGAGATIFEGKRSSDPIGILSHITRTDTYGYLDLLSMDKSYDPIKENMKAAISLTG